MDFGSVPILPGADPENAALVRALAALLLIAFIVYLVAMRPFRGIIGYFAKKVRKPTSKN
jgi:hypothetical protein